MTRIGIVGAENSHTVAIAKTINIEKLVPDAQVVAVWGETPELARDASERGQIPNVVAKPDGMIGMVDGVVVDHRHAREHLAAAEPYLEAGIPLFIDKPFCYRLDEGVAFLKKARNAGVAVTSYSIVPKQKSFLNLTERIKTLGPLLAIITTGPCDIHSPYGGIFFYGIHQIDMMLRLGGYDPVEVSVHRGAGKNHLATIHFRSGLMAAMNLIGDGAPRFQVSVIGKEGRIDEVIDYDASPHLAGIEEFVGMFRTGKTVETDETMLGPVALLEALEQAAASDAPVATPVW